MIKFSIEFYSRLYYFLLLSCMLTVLFTDANGQNQRVIRIAKEEQEDLNYPIQNYSHARQLGPMDATANITHAFCTGSSDGSIHVNIAASDLPFTYSFDGKFGGKAYGSYWRLIEIDNPGSQLSHYQVRVVIPDADKSNTNFSDIRFSDTSLTQLYSYWFEEVEDGDAAFWVKLPVIPAGKSFLKVYYGNTAAIAQSNGYTTFDYFDDFEDGDYSDWSTGCDLKSNSTEACNVSLTDEQGVGKYLQLLGYADCIGGFSRELQTTISKYIALIPGNYSFDYAAKLTVCLHTTCSGKTDVQTYAQLDGQYHSQYTYAADQLGACGCRTTSWFQSRSEIFTDNGSGHMFKIISELWDCSREGSGIDNFRIRKSVANPPVVTVGAEHSIVYTGLKAGEYTFSIINSASQEFTRKFVVNEPALPKVDTVSLCGLGKVDFKVKGIYTSYNWYDFNNVFLGSSDTTYTISQVNTTSTYYLTGIGTNGCESSPKAMAVARVKNVSSAGSIYSDKKNVCAGDSIKLSLTNRVGYILGWEISFDSINFNKHYTSILDTSFTFIPFKGKTYIKSITKNEGCTPDTSDVFVVEVHAPPFAFISGTDTILPNEKTDAVKLINLNGNVVEWQKSYDPQFNNYTVINASENGIVDSNLISTAYYRVKVQSGACLPLLSNVTTVRVNRSHNTFTDTASVSINSELWNHPGLLYNDIDPDGDQLEIQETDWLKTSNNGKIKFNQNGTFYYAPAYNYSGVDSVSYTVCDKHQSHLKYCVASKLMINVEEVKQPIPQLHVFNAISPNGDNSNDSWIIQGIESYPDNEVFIYDRFGNLVFEEKGYDNSEDKKWRGTANAGILTPGQQLPSGTYYYLIHINSLGKKLSGYIELHR